MSFVGPFHAILIALLSAAGIANLYWMIQRRNSPAEARGCLLAGVALLLLAGSLAAQIARHNGLAWLSGGLGMMCVLIWFYHIYVQSLHNTTM